MDTFGRLPNDVITLIENIYHKPLMDIKIDFDKYRIFLIIKFRYVTIELNLVAPIMYYIDKKTVVNDDFIILRDFLLKMKNNDICEYIRPADNPEDDEIFIYIKHNEIIIDNTTNKIYLDICIKNELYKILNQYYNFLDAFEKEYSDHLM